MIVSALASSAAPVGCRFPREVIAVAVRWYLRYGLSYRDLEELLTERGITVDHVSVYRRVQTLTPEAFFIRALRSLTTSPEALLLRWMLLGETPREERVLSGFTECSSSTLAI